MGLRGSKSQKAGEVRELVFTGKKCGWENNIKIDVKEI